MASITITLSPQQADEFLRRLSEDDNYREQLQHDPSSALAEYGISVSDDLVPRLRELPAKDVIQRVRTSELPFTPLPNRPEMGACAAYATAVLVQALGKPPPDTLPPDAPS